MDSDRSAGQRRKLPRWFVPALGYTLSVISLIWVYYGFNWKRELPKVLATDWHWVATAVAADVFVYFIQGWRWKILLRPIKEVPLLRTVQAIYIGLFANEILPLRSGEVIRAYLQGKWNSISFSVVFSSVIIERLLDGAWLALGFYLIAHWIKLPDYLVVGADVLVIVLAIFAALLAMTVIYKSRAHAAVANSRWASLLWHVVEGSHNMGHSLSFLAAAFVTVLFLGVQVVPVYVLALGYGLKLSWSAAAVVLVILRLGSIPPQAPSNVGGFQFFTILALELFGIGKADAAGYATLLFIVVTVPLWVGGFLSLIATRMRLHDIHGHAHRHLAESKRAAESETGSPGS